MLQKGLTGTTPKGAWGHADFDKDVDSLIQSAREDLFVSSNVESQEANVVTYRLRSDDFCDADPIPSVPVGSDAGPPGPPPETSGENFYREHVPRLVVRRVACEAGDNLHIDLTIDEDRKKIILVIGTTTSWQSRST